LIVVVAQGHNQTDAKYNNAHPDQDAAEQCQALKAGQGGPRWFLLGFVRHSSPFMEI
jgi:hypothetical protein